MKICVTGFFFEPWSFIEVLSKVALKHAVTIINKRHPGPTGIPENLLLINRPNVGLEFETYDYYLRVLWDGMSNVLFIHDDTICHDPEVFDRIAQIPHDVAYLFRDYAEEKANAGKHGRAIFCSHKFLDLAKKEGGFWYDEENFGYTGHGQKRPNREDGSPIDFNAGIHTFHRYLGRVRDRKIGLDVVNRVFFPELEHGRRGTWRHKDREIKRYGTG